MRNIDVILEAIYVLDISNREFETMAGLKAGRLFEIKEDVENDLTEEELSAIAEVYTAEFRCIGYHFISNTLFNQVFVTKDRISIN
jgi:hypothetical protein